MQKSQYARNVPAILAEMEKSRNEGSQQQPRNHQTEANEEKVVYVYRTSDGGVFLSPTKVGDQAQQSEIIIDSDEQEADHRPATHNEPPYFLHFLLILLVFMLLDNVATFFTLLTPTVTITITPTVKTISSTAILTVGEGADVHGRVFVPLTLSQQQTVNATGHGHQDAQQAQGSLLFYNASFSSQTISAGSIFTGGDGIQIATSATVIIPANNPPQDGTESVSAYALNAGQQGNIQALDVNSTASNSLFVKNLDPFTGGRSARDFTIVSKGDVQGIVTTVTPGLLHSEQAALSTQLIQGESLVSPSCTPSTKANHAPGDEAQTVTVTVSETCSSIAYSQHELQRAGERILDKTLVVSLTHFQQVGDIHLNILSQTLSGKRATLKVQLSGVWVYQLDHHRITTFILGKPRLNALHLLSIVPGVQSVSIAGVTDNNQLPSDVAHIQLNIFYFLP
ncbi:MAG: baseplate J/gp47 family protein [Ktedonobacteraceae bacterium]